MKNLIKLLIYGFIFVSVTGTLMHFVYGWSGNNPLIGIFAPVNESVWEHMKLVFFPMLLFSLFAKIKYKNTYNDIFPLFSFGTLAGTYLIPVIFYTYSGILGFNIAIIDMLSFYICVFTSLFCIYKYFPEKKSKFHVLLLLITCFLFLIFTFHPLNISLFKSPV